MIFNIGDNIKVVYVDNNITKVLKGILEDETDLLITLNLNGTNKKTIIGKRAIVKISGIEDY